MVHKQLHELTVEERVKALNSLAKRKGPTGNVNVVFITDLLLTGRPCSAPHCQGCAILLPEMLKEHVRLQQINATPMN